MGKIDLARRAEIGRTRRARSRARLTTAARTLFARRPVNSITVEDVTTSAGVAKGTFYVHFRDLDELRSAIADELVCELDELVQPARLATADPVERIATACEAFIVNACSDRAWGALIARAMWAFPAVTSIAGERLCEDLELAVSRRRIAAISPELGRDIALGIVVQAIASASKGRLLREDVAAAVTAILRALGARPPEITRLARQLAKSGSHIGARQRSGANKQQKGSSQDVDKPVTI